jgi:hypothetical protein
MVLRDHRYLYILSFICKKQKYIERPLVFNKTTIQNSINYSPIEEIKILYNSTTNTFNTFNTFWKGVERNGDYKDKAKSNKITKSEQILDILDRISKNNDENNQNSSAILIEDKTKGSVKVLEVLEVLEDQKKFEDTKNTANKPSNFTKYNIL